MSKYDWIEFILTLIAGLFLLLFTLFVVVGGTYGMIMFLKEIL